MISVDAAGLSGGPGCRYRGRVDTAERGGPCGRGQGSGAPPGNGLDWVVCVEQVISGFVWKEPGWVVRMNLAGYLEAVLCCGLGCGQGSEFGEGCRGSGRQALSVQDLGRGAWPLGLP